MPCPPRSIWQCIPDVRVRSDARNSRQVLGKETLLPTNCSLIEEYKFLSFSNSCCRSVSSKSVTFNSSSSTSRSAPKDTSLAAKRSFILTLKYSYLNSYLCYKYVLLYWHFGMNNQKNDWISLSYKFFGYLFQLRLVVQWKAIGRRRQNRNRDGNL